jgi:4-hydroxyproline epimerase
VLRLDTPAGLVEATYTRVGEHVESVRLTNVPGYLHAEGVVIDCPGIGELAFDVSYGGNFYAILEPQKNYRDMADFSPGDILRLSPIMRRLLNEAITCVHPENPTIKGVSHILWTGKAKNAKAHARNAVFYGDKAIDRSPCGTGTSARMAQLAARGKLKVGDEFIHESIIGSLFNGRIERAAKVGNHDAIVPSVEGWARITGYNTIFIDDRDPYAKGFQLV